jgi:YbbR domain-containing protein
MKKLLLNNYKIKIVSFLLAVGLWWFVNASQNPRMSTSFPAKVEYMNLAPEFRLESAAKSVRVELQGSSRALENIGPENLRAVADLAGLREGLHRVGISIINRTSLRARVKTREVDVLLKPLKKIELPVELRFFESLPGGYSRGKVTYKPMSAIVYGERDELKSVARLVVRVNLADRVRSFRARAAITAEDDSGNLLTEVHTDPAAVAVKVPVISELGKTVPVKISFKNPGEEKNYPDAYYLPRELKLSGDPVVLKKMNAARTEEFDAGVCAGGGAYQLRLKLPKGVIADTDTVTFNCAPPKAESKTLSVALRPINPCDGCSAELNPQEIKITMNGPSDILSKLDSESVAASVDLLGLKPGEYELQPYTHLKQMYEQVKLDYHGGPVKVAITKTGE